MELDLKKKPEDMLSANCADNVLPVLMDSDGEEELIFNHGTDILDSDFSIKQDEETEQETMTVQRTVSSVKKEDDDMSRDSEQLIIKAEPSEDHDCDTGTPVKTEAASPDPDREICNICSESVLKKEFRRHVLERHCGPTLADRQDLASTDSGEPLAKKAKKSLYRIKPKDRDKGKKVKGAKEDSQDDSETLIIKSATTESSESATKNKKTAPSAKKNKKSAFDSAVSDLVSSYESEEACSNCLELFSSTKKLANHMSSMVCRGQRAVRCPLCGAGMLNWQGFDHFWNCHKETLKNYSSDDKSEVLMGLSGLNQNGISNQSESPSWPCEHCEANFGEEAELEMHRVAFHDTGELYKRTDLFLPRVKLEEGDPNQTSSSRCQPEDRKKPTFLHVSGRPRFKCSQCNAVFHSALYLVGHKEVFHPKKQTYLMLEALRSSNRETSAGGSWCLPDQQSLGTAIDYVRNVRLTATNSAGGASRDVKGDSSLATQRAAKTSPSWLVYPRTQGGHPVNVVVRGPSQPGAKDQLVQSMRPNVNSTSTPLHTRRPILLYSQGFSGRDSVRQ